MIQHVALEVREEDAPACERFWGLLGFARVEPPPSLRERAVWVERAATVVPGHGAPVDSVRALALLREDVAYLEALPEATLPLARRSARQRGIHEDNVGRLRS